MRGGMSEDFDYLGVVHMPVASLVAVRNLKDGLTVLTPDASNPKSYMEWQAKGDPSGGDYQYVSEDVVATPAFAKAIQHGVLAVDPDEMSPEVAQAFTRQMEVAKDRQARAAQEIAKSLDRTDNRDIITISCVGPGDVKGSPCGAPVAVREMTASERVPLCTRHQSLAPEYIPTEEFDGTNHKITWVRVEMGSRERGA
jgi:hypothetical protein